MLSADDPQSLVAVLSVSMISNFGWHKLFFSSITQNQKSYFLTAHLSLDHTSYFLSRHTTPPLDLPVSSDLFMENTDNVSAG